jgi:hypothetical protein
MEDTTMTTEDLWGGDREWTINYAFPLKLGEVLLAPNNVLTQFKLTPITDGDIILGYDVAPINLPSAWTSEPCRFFCFGSTEPQWPTKWPPGQTPLTQPLPPYASNPDAHHALSTAIVNQYGVLPSTARLQGEIHVGNNDTPETVILYKVENAIEGNIAFIAIDVQSDPLPGSSVRESGAAHGNN